MGKALYSDVGYQTRGYKRCVKPNGRWVFRPRSDPSLEISLDGWAEMDIRGNDRFGSIVSERYRKQTYCTYMLKLCISHTYSTLFTDTQCIPF